MQTQLLIASVAIRFLIQEINAAINFIDLVRQPPSYIRLPEGVYQEEGGEIIYRI